MGGEHVPLTSDGTQAGRDCEACAISRGGL